LADHALRVRGRLADAPPREGLSRALRAAGEAVIETEHYRKLERAYRNAPVSRWYGVEASIADGEAEIRVAIKPEFLHAAGSGHRAVYFRLLDDAAFFAVNSRVPDVFVLTVSFTVQLARAVTGGVLRSK